MRGKERRYERMQGIYRGMEPFRIAKKNTIRSLGAVGRKHKYLRYPIFIGLVAFIFVYNVFFHAFIQLKVREKMARAMAVTMTVIMVLTSIDLSVLALAGEKQGYYELTEYQTESDSIMVPLGTSVEEIELPEKLVSTLAFYEVIETENSESPADTVQTTDIEATENADVIVQPEAPEAPESEAPAAEESVPEDTLTPPATDSMTEETPVSTENITVESVTVEPESFYASPETESEVIILTSENEAEELAISSEEPVVQEPVGTDAVICEEEVPVTWICDNYDANTLGEYIFTAQFPTEYKGCELRVLTDTLPVLIVRVVEPQIVIGNQVVDGIEIELKAAPGVFPEGAVMSVSKVTDEEIVTLIEDTIQQEIDANKKDEEDQTTLQSTVTFDIVVLDSDGNEIQPDIPKGMTEQEAICVTFKQVVSVLEVECEEDEVTNMQVYHVEDSYDAVELLESGTSEEDVFFSPEHFSYYSCACTHSNYKSVSSWNSLYKAIYNKTGTINIKLTSDIEIEKLILYSNSNRIYIHKGQTVNIDLNGYDITSETGKEAVELKKGTLNIHDRKGTGTISAEDGSRVIYITGSSTFNLKGGTIQKQGKESWGIDVVSDATVNISGGRINGSFSCGIWASASYDVDIKMTGGTINGASQGIYFGSASSNNGSITMTGGTISNSTSSGIYNGGTTLTLSGGTISGNASYKAYGVQVTGTYAKINLSGSPQFSNNRAADIYVGSYTNNRINVTGTLSGSAIGIATATTPTDASPVQFTGASSYAVANMDKFYSKASSSYGVWNPNSTSYLVTGPMGNRTITAEMVFVETKPATNANGEVAQIALGSAAPVASNATEYDISTIVKFNTPMSFNATLADTTNYEFKGWRKKGTTTILSTSPTYTFDAKDHLNLEAVFARKTCTVTITMSDYSAARGNAYITGYKIGDTSQSVSANMVTGTFEMGSTLTLKAAPLTKDNVTYEFYQWNDGDKAATKTVTVTGDVVYTAQFKNPAPDPNAVGYIFIGVQELTAYPSTGSLVLLIGDGEKMTNTSGDAQIAVAGLPGDYAEVTAVANGTTRQEYNYSADQYSAVIKEKYGTNVSSVGGKEVSVSKAGDDFDTCPGGKIVYYTGTKANGETESAWYFWCDGGAKDGVGPYNAYTYIGKKSYVASNITATYNDIVYSEDKKTVEKIDLDVTITVDNVAYSIANLQYFDKTINYAEGDKTVELDLGGVAFTYVLPEATVISYDTNGEVVGRVHYDTLQQAIEAAEEGDTIEVIGNAVSEIATKEGVAINSGVKIESFNGMTITTGEATDGENDTIKINVEKDGTIELMEGTMTATPATSTSGESSKKVEVSVTGAKVTAQEEITVSTDSNGQGQVSTSKAGADITISPDGDASHTVVFEGCVADKEYGVHSGEMTTESKVTISSGTQYELEVPLGESEKIIQTNPTNTGDTTITKGKDEDGYNTIIIDSEKPNDTVVVETPVTDENGNTTTISQTYTTSEENTKLVVSETSDDVVLENGGVNVPKGGSVVLPSGEKIQNNSATGCDNITISVDENNKESIIIPGGSSAMIGDTVVSVPPAESGAPSNLPIEVELKEDGSMDVTAKSGNEVIIGGETYEIGDYDAVFEIDPEADPNEPPVVKEGTVVLQPGQSITDANGVTYTNPETKPGEEPKALEITMTEGNDSEVTVAPGQSFEYTPAGSDEPIVYDNPGSSDTSFVVAPDGDVSLGSDIVLGDGDEVDVELGGTQAKVLIPEGNSGVVNVDPIEGNIIIGTAGDKVIIGEETYIAGQDNTVLKPGADGVELSSGAVILGSDKEIIVNGSKVENTGDSECGVQVGNDGQVAVNVPKDGSFTLSDPNSDQSIQIVNPADAQKTYTIDQNGAIIVPEDTDITFEQNGKEVTVSAPDDGDLTVIPTEDGVEVMAPDGGDVTINGMTYENAGASGEGLTFVIQPNGDAVLVEGTTVLPENGSILLPGGENGIQSTNGNVVVDAEGSITMPDGSAVTVTGPDGVVGSYTAEGDVMLDYDPETGIPVIDKASTGSVVLGQDSKIDVIYDSMVETDEDGDETYPEDLKATITNTGGAGAVVLPGGDVLVPENGAVTIESTKLSEDGTLEVVQNVIRVPENSADGSATIEINKDGTVNVTVPNENSAVNVNGTEYITGANTEIHVSGDGNTLVSGSVTLDGNQKPKESIIVNGIEVTNSGAANTSIDVSKNNDGTVGLEVGAGAQFDIAVPGAADSKVTFENTGENEANYTVNADGSIDVNDGFISFTTAADEKVEVGSENGDITLKVTKDGVELSAPAGTDIVINGVTYPNTDGNLVIIVGPDGKPVLKEGTTMIPSGGSILLPNGKTVSSENGTVTVDKDGNLSVPSGVTTTIISSDGTAYSYSATGSGASISMDEDSNVPMLNSGSVELMEGSEIGVDDSVIEATGTNAPVVNADGTILLPAGGDSGVILKQTVVDGSGTASTTETQINAPAGNHGAISVTENADGEIEVGLSNKNDCVDIDGAVYESNTDEETKIAITEDGNELVSGGVSLAGGNTSEGIIVNGTEVTNIGNGTIDVTKNADGTVGLEAGEGAQFELMAPGAEDSAVTFSNNGDSANYTVNADGSIAVNDGSSITYITEGNKEITVSGKAEDPADADITFKVTEDGVELGASEGTDIVINNKVYENEGNADEDLIITVAPNGSAILTEGTAGVPDGGALQLLGGSTVEAENGNVTVDEEGDVSVPSGVTTIITSADGTSQNAYTANGSDAMIETETDSDIPVLTNGSVLLPEGSTIQSGDSVIEGAGADAVVNADGSVLLPAGSAVMIQNASGNAESLTGIIGADANNNGNITITSDANGNPVVTVEEKEDQVNVDGIVYETTEDETQIAMTREGNALLEGGVSLDGGDYAETIIANGTEFSNTSTNGAEVDVTKTPEGTSLSVGEEGQFDMAVPGERDSAVSFRNEGDGAAEYTVNGDGSIGIEDGSSISFETEDGDWIQVSGTGTENNEDADITLKITEEGVNLTAPEGTDLKINDTVYENVGGTGESLSMTVDEYGDKTILSGTAIVPAGDTVSVSDANGNRIEISKEGDSLTDTSITVSSTGEIDASIGDTIRIGEGSYTCNDTFGEFDLAIDSETGAVIVEKGAELEIKNGSVILVDSEDPNHKVTVSTTGDKSIEILNTGDAEPEIIVPAGGNAAITNKDGDVVEVIVSEEGESASDSEVVISVDEDGNLSLDMKAGMKVTIGGVAYTAEQDGVLKVDGETGEVVDSSIGDAIPVIDPELFNKDNYKYELEPGEQVYVGDVLYTVPEGNDGNVILSGNEDGNPVITIEEDGDSVKVGDHTYTADSTNTMFVVNDTADGSANVTLVDNGSNTENSSLALRNPDTLTVDGNTFTANGTGTSKAATIRKTEDGNEINVMTGEDVSVELGTDTDLEVVGKDTVKIGDVPYTAPSGGMTLSGNANGNPTITVPNGGQTVKVGDESYTAGSDDTQFIVNKKGNVTLVDNGNTDENSSLVVHNPSSLTIDGNKITSTGAAGGGYVIEKTEDGNSMEIAQDTTISVSMGANGAAITIQETVNYNGQTTGGDSITLKPSSNSGKVIIDKTQTDSEGNYITNLKPSQGTKMTPIVDENGVVIGFVTSAVVPNSGTTSNPDSEPETEAEAESVPSSNGDLNERESLETEEEDTSSDSNADAEADGEDAMEEESADNFTEDVIVMESVEDAEGVLIEEALTVQLGKGTINISVEGDGILSCDVQTLLYACFTEEELQNVLAGENVEIRLNIEWNENPDKKDFKAIKDAYKFFENKVSGFVLADTYVIVVERRIGNSDWEVLHELNYALDLTIEIPEDILADGRTYFMMRNHQGTCTLLSDMDERYETITVSTAAFSVYAIMYSDEDVTGLNLDEINSAMLSGEDDKASFYWIPIAIGICVITAFGIYIVIKKRKERESEIKF